MEVAAPYASRDLSVMPTSQVSPAGDGKTCTRSSASWPSTVHAAARLREGGFVTHFQ